MDVFTDAYWAGNVDDRKSTIGGAFILGGILVAWTRKKKTCVSQSTVEEEYVVASMNCMEAIWMRHV